jgi:glycosyltransferase involved in cell wall biosynthesis
MPHISVVIPTYNRKDYLKEAIASCFEGNEGVRVEVVVVDDGSTDGTREYLTTLTEPRVRPIFQGDQGPQEARNRGLSAAKGDFIKFLDDDDWLESGALEREIGVLRQTDSDITYGCLDIVDESGRTQKIVEAPPVSDLASAILNGSLLTLVHRFTCRRNILQEIQWDPELSCRQDLAFFLAVALEEPKITRVDRRVGYHRVHGGDRICKVGDGDIVHQTHLQILVDAAEALSRRGNLDPQRRQAVAEGLWTRGHMISAQNWEEFERIYDRIRSICPHFRPNRHQSSLSLIDRLLGPKTTELIISLLRR